MQRLYHFCTALLLSLTLVIAGCSSSSTKFKQIRDYWVLPTEEIISLAHKEDAYAQLLVSNFYRYGGNGVPYDEALADEWNQKALPNLILLAEQGSAEAAYLTALQYLKNEKTDPISAEKAQHYLEQAAQLGNPTAQMQLADRAKDTDQKKSVYWREKATLAYLKEAEQGVITRQCDLAIAYDNILASLESTSNASLLNNLSSKNKTYWRQQCYSSLREELSHIDENKRPLSFGRLILFITLSFDDVLDLEPNNIKGYVIANYAANRFEGNAKDFSENFQNIFLDRMNEIEETKAIALAKQCIVNFTDRCY